MSLGEVWILPTLLYTGVSFAGHCVVGGGWLNKLDEKIPRILFGEGEAAYADFCREYAYNEKSTKSGMNGCPENVMSIRFGATLGMKEICRYERWQRLRTHQEIEVYQAGSRKEPKTVGNWEKK